MDDIVKPFATNFPLIIEFITLITDYIKHDT